LVAYQVERRNQNRLSLQDNKHRGTQTQPDPKGSPMWSYLIIGTGYAFAAAMQPGPFQTFLLSETMSRGWRRTMPAALAPLLSDAPILAIVLLVLSRIPEGMVRFLHLAGAIFLFFLAYGTCRTWKRYDHSQSLPRTAGPRTLLKAALVNFLNPNPWLGWCLVMGPLLLKGYRETPAHGIALVAGFYVTMVASLAGLITLFAFARNLGPRVTKAALGLSAVALACFGVYQLWLGVRAG
jgi:threonine/homoserine/homoserine lactone efflux protein